MKIRLTFLVLINFFILSYSFSDEKFEFTSCNITFVNREKLIFLLDKKGLSRTCLEQIIADKQKVHGKLVLGQLNAKNEGYLFFLPKTKRKNL